MGGFGPVASDEGAQAEMRRPDSQRRGETFDDELDDAVQELRREEGDWRVHGWEEEIGREVRGERQVSAARAKRGWSATGKEGVGSFYRTCA